MIVHPERYSSSNVSARKAGVVVHASESGDGSFQYRASADA